MPHLGKLERIDLREAWLSEPSDFTPWLAQETNIAQLSEALGYDADSLEVESQEQSVGPFRADILCKNTIDDSWVLIENQLERTDHTHLGQLLTYASGLNTVTIVWIARTFTEEHRAALDWLNDVTPDKINFFGIEIELWRIAESPMAPKFNIVAKPNVFTKGLMQARSGGETANLTETKRRQLAYWTAFNAYMADHSNLRPQKPGPQHWTSVAMGVGGFFMHGLVNTRDKNITAQVKVEGANSVALYRLLEKQREKIDAEFGPGLNWRFNSGKKQRYIDISHDCDPMDEADWPRQHQWLCEQLKRLKAVIRPYAKNLDPAQWTEDEGADGESEGS